MKDKQTIQATSWWKRQRKHEKDKWGTSPTKGKGYVTNCSFKRTCCYATSRFCLLRAAAIWWALESALSAVRFETASADTQCLPAASPLVLRWDWITWSILLPLVISAFALTATSTVRRLKSKHTQQCYILPPDLRLATLLAGGARDLQVAVLPYPDTSTLSQAWQLVTSIGIYRWVLWSAEPTVNF
jgi:hypothetical protein